MVAGTTTVAAEDADTVSLVDHHGGIVFLGQTYNLGQVGYVALHRENTVGHNQLHLVGVAVTQLLFERFHIVVTIFYRSRERQTAAFDNRSMGELVPQNIIATAGHTGYDTQIDLKSS